MKLHVWLVALFLSFLLESCLIYSFYPLYNSRDLFVNHLLMGTWEDEDSTLWKFEHIPPNSRNLKGDRTAYRLVIKVLGEEWMNKSMEVRLVKLGGHYFADFYIHDYPDSDEADFFDYHLIPAHTFARVEFSGGGVRMSWFSEEWFRDQFKRSKPCLKFLESPNHILMYGRTPQLQRFVRKYADSEEAFEGGIQFTLKRVNS